VSAGSVRHRQPLHHVEQIESDGSPTSTAACASGLTVRGGRFEVIGSDSTTVSVMKSMPECNPHGWIGAANIDQRQQSGYTLTAHALCAPGTTSSEREQDS
jgi:hypothetical protein